LSVAIAKNLATFHCKLELAASRIFRRHRRVWFVAHSMGGRTLALWKLQGKIVLLDRILGVGMLGVPSAGSPLADLVTKAGVAEVARVLGWDSALVKNLSSDGEGQHYLDSLETDWMAVKAARDSGPVRRFIPIIDCGYQTKSEFRVLELAFGAQYGTVVPKLFATSACDDRRGFSVSHIQLPKPASAKAPVHGSLRDLIMRSSAAGAQEHRDEITTAPDVPLSVITLFDGPACALFEG
jgi:alpha-beta hydrolase superfamily lysophospholipase